MWKSPYVLLLVATCLWGGNFVVGKAIVADIPPLMLAATRWMLALLLVLPIWGKELRANRPLLLKHWRMVLFLSLTGVAGFNTLTYIAVQYTDSINASLMNAATPIIVVLLSTLMLREKTAWNAIPAILISMVGVLWIISHGTWSAISGLSFNSGDLWMIVAITCWAAYSVGMKKVAGVLPVNALFVAKIIVALMVLVPSSIVEWIVRQPQLHLTAPLTAGVIYVGIFASVVAFSSWNSAIMVLGPARCSGFLNFIPLFSAIFATLFRGEVIHYYHLIGACLIVTGVFWMNRVLQNGTKTNSTRATAA
ncbi:DMT family transporter [Paenibacillus cremeus]|uniref:DMT family transporter n=1 Tax=Paenibacillus cremeus TaxID=2163881 RepID=A0A559K543_9BACL|nr:DMT family transporter [Paenibacillus cremeus]TVY07259.1 DMT family transporter [Paenibacillus cremeus]